VIVRIILQPFSYLALYWSPRRLSHFGWNGMQSQPGLWSVRKKKMTKIKLKTFERSSKFSIKQTENPTKIEVFQTNEKTVQITF